MLVNILSVLAENKLTSQSIISLPRCYFLALMHISSPIIPTKCFFKFHNYKTQKLIKSKTANNDFVIIHLVGNIYKMSQEINKWNFFPQLVYAMRTIFQLKFKIVSTDVSSGANTAYLPAAAMKTYSMSDAGFASHQPESKVRQTFGLVSQDY